MSLRLMVRPWQTHHGVPLLTKVRLVVVTSKQINNLNGLNKINKPLGNLGFFIYIILYDK